MIYTQEQINKAIAGSSNERRRRLDAIDAARHALANACASCWFRRHEGECEEKACSVWRMFAEAEKATRMHRQCKIDYWDLPQESTDRLLFQED